MADAHRGAADDATGAAIDSALALPPGLDPHEAWNAIDFAMQDAAAVEDEVTINIADAIFPRLDVQPSQDWIDLLTEQHGVSVEPLDFAGDGVGSTRRINDWIEDQTQGLIADLLPEGFIQPSTVLVLADAVYFKARWDRPFGKYGTVTEPFTRLDGSADEVEFMRELELSSVESVTAMPRPRSHI